MVSAVASVKRFCACGAKVATGDPRPSTRSACLGFNNFIPLKILPPPKRWETMGVPKNACIFWGKCRKKKRCFQPLDFPRRQRLPRSSCGKAIASLRGVNERRRYANCKRLLFVATPIAKPLRLTPQVCFADYRLCRTFGMKMPSRTIRSPRRRGRGSKIRTHGTRFWRPLLYQLSYTPIFTG